MRHSKRFVAVSPLNSINIVNIVNFLVSFEFLKSIRCTKSVSGEYIFLPTCTTDHLSRGRLV